MRVVSLLAQKGGTGKTTLALHWAVEARGPVAVVDMDPQGSAASWHVRRGKDFPLILAADGGNISQAVEACRGNGIETVLIDTAPHVEAATAAAARVSDLAVIPCGPSVLDIEAIGRTVATVRAVNTAAAVVVNQGRHSSGINDTAAELLKQYGLPVCPVTIMRRAVLEDALIDGRAVAELEPNGKAAREIAAAWQWINKLTS